MSRLFRDLMTEVDKGIKGENGTIPLQLGRLDEYLEISKGTMYLIGAEPSGGKTSFTLDQFMIYPLKYYLEMKDEIDIKLDIIYFCMERSQVMNTAKMISKFIFEDTGILIPVKKIMGRKKEKLTEGELELIKQYEPLVEEFSKHLKVVEGVKDVSYMGKFMNDYADKHGKIKKITDDDGEIIHEYEPHHPNHITLIIVDHIGLMGREKDKLDEFSTLMRKSKDFYKFSPIIIQQLNRNIADNGRKSSKNKPKLSDFEGTAGTQQDAEVVIVVYNPYTHIYLEDDDETTTDSCGYNLPELRNDWGIPCYRSVHLLKNTYGGAGLSAGLAFHAPTGTFKTLPKLEEITPYDYQEVRNSKYFLK